ncbi:hypothetical protein DFH09DRAFT_1159544 [Mycena vulgaris]|nr:hypothetical protein DFH09DRAFT_1159544 [Mycena vulgaris]
MNHPYSGAAGYIYANEHPYTPVDSRPKNPYGKLPSFVPSPSSIKSNPLQAHAPSSRKSHDSSWSTEGTYTRTQRPKHDDTPVGRPRGNSQSRPPIPLRVPILHPYQQRSASWVDLTDDSPTTKAKTNVMIVPPERSTSRPPNRMTPYERDGDPLSLRHSAFVPYEPRPFEAERARAKKAASWRGKIQNALEQRRLRRALTRLRRLMRFES